MEIMVDFKEKEIIDMSLEQVQRLYMACKKINRLLRKHRNKLVRGNRLLRREEKYQNHKVKYFLLFKVPAFGKDRSQIEDRVICLSNLISDVESFASTYEGQIKNAG